MFHVNDVVHSMCNIAQTYSVNMNTKQMMMTKISFIFPRGKCQLHGFLVQYMEVVSKRPDSSSSHLFVSNILTLVQLSDSGFARVQ